MLIFVCIMLVPNLQRYVKTSITTFNTMHIFPKLDGFQMLLNFSLEIFCGITVIAFDRPPSMLNAFRKLFRCILQATISGGGQNEKHEVNEGNAQPVWKLVLTVLVLAEPDPEYVKFLVTVVIHLD